jgi:hypothetical protein
MTDSLSLTVTYFFALSPLMGDSLGNEGENELLAFPALLYLVPIDWLNQQHTICLFKNIFGRECPGCGITRAVLSVLHFDFENAYHYNKLVIIVFPLLSYIWIRRIISYILHTDR